VLLWIKPGGNRVDSGLRADASLQRVRDVAVWLGRGLGASAAHDQEAVERKNEARQGDERHDNKTRDCPCREGRHRRTGREIRGEPLLAGARGQFGFGRFVQAHRVSNEAGDDVKGLVRDRSWHHVPTSRDCGEEKPPAAADQRLTANWRLVLDHVPAQLFGVVGIIDPDL